MARSQHVFGAVNYYVLENNRLHTVAVSFPLSFFQSNRRAKNTKLLPGPTSHQSPHQQEALPGPRALVYFEKLTQHQLRALLAPVPPRGCLPQLFCADTDSGLPMVAERELHPPVTACRLLGPPGLRLLFQMTKHTVLRSSKPHISGCLTGRKVAIVYFREQPASIFLPPPLLLFPPLLPRFPNLFSSFLSFSHLFPFLLFSILLFLFPCSFLSSPRGSSVGDSLKSLS